ncbi:DUF397 domain-containing protein [Streptomyces sp. NPDC020707]|uniref:DUF397 domain-containing protein n=1 Tax=Streptomyces ortus TaxID=2867268 RepID=A0ABT3V6U2_9ACTN|nr:MULTISPECIES: DUF397 domain-containing protein [Streptomyces]MCX4235694.1 DUF397 domain-containing protein [Streptomyces ortus]
MRNPYTAQAPWQKSSFSGDQEGPNCLEIGAAHSTLLLRESEDPGTVLEATGVGLAGLIRHLRRDAEVPVPR